jgi:hypothetical protein
MGYVQNMCFQMGRGLYPIVLILIWLSKDKMNLWRHKFLANLHIGYKKMLLRCC